MANMQIKGPDEFMSKLGGIGKESVSICQDAVKAGAGIVADEVRKNLKSVPEDKYRFLRDGEKFAGVPKEQKKDLLEGLGITPVGTDKTGAINAKIGFDGYGTFKTKKYPSGVPNKLLARAVESGSSVRQKTPFVRKAVNSSKKRAVEEMGRSIETDLKKLGL